MSRQQVNEQGFSVIEIILVIVIVGLLLGMGYMFYKGHKNTTATTTATKTTIVTPAQPKTVTDPYAGWKSGSLQYEKVSYKYPADWSIKDASSSVPKSAGACVYPGTDLVTLTSPTKETVVLHAGVWCIGDANTKPYQADAIKSLGQDLYLVYQNGAAVDRDPTGPAYACLATTQTPDTFLAMKTKNIFTQPPNESPQPTAASYCYFPYDTSSTSTPVPTDGSVKSIQATADFKNAKLILESLKYQ